MIVARRSAGRFCCANGPGPLGEGPEGAMGEGNAHLLLLAAAMVGLYLLMRRRSMTRHADLDSSTRPARYRVPRLGETRHIRPGLAEGADLSADLHDAPPELVRWQVAMHELARDLKGEIDTKLSALQTLVALARQESARLQTLLDQAARVSSPRAADAAGAAPLPADFSAVSARPPSHAARPPTGESPLPAEFSPASSAADTACRPRETLARLADLADPAALANPSALAEAAQSLPPRTASDPLADNAIEVAIGRLAEQGQTPEAIAQQLGLPLGEVELRLSLRPRYE
jgi:hypothetical protein